jgi:hypothetical protein
MSFNDLTEVTGAAIAAGPSSQFDLSGDVVTPGGRNTWRNDRVWRAETASE